MFKKRWIAILVVFAMVAGTAFAQANLGGQLQIGMVAAEGNNVKDDDVFMGGSYTGDGVYHASQLSVTFGDGTGGGRLVWRPHSEVAWGWMQWRPSQYFRMKIGHDRDGEWGAAQITGWGFTGEAKNAVAAVNDWGGHFAMGGVKRSNAFFGGIGDGENTSLNLSFYPTDDMSVSLFFTNVTDRKEITQHLANGILHLTYRIEDVGTVRFTAQGRGALAQNEERDGMAGGNIADIFLSFFSAQIIPSATFDLGFKYNLPHMDADSQGPMNIGLGLTYAAEPFNLKIRAGVQMGAKDAAGEAIPTEFGIGILPNYRLNPNSIFFFHAGFRMLMTDDDDAQKTGWFINPYIWVRAAESLRFWIGLQILDQSNVRDGQIQWRIPFGFNCYF